jgi:hypothetical protein
MLASISELVNFVSSGVFEPSLVRLKSGEFFGLSFFG